MAQKIIRLENEDVNGEGGLKDAFALLAVLPIMAIFPLLFNILSIPVSAIGIFYPLALTSIFFYSKGKLSTNFGNLASTAALISITSIVVAPAVLIWLYWELQDMALATAAIATAAFTFIPVALIWFLEDKAPKNKPSSP